MKRTFFTIVFLIFAANTAFASVDYTSIIKKMVPANVNVVLKRTNEYNIAGFKTFVAALKPQNSSVTVYKYVWVSNDGKLIIPTLLSYSGQFNQIEPETKATYNVINIEWFNKVLMNIPADLKKSYGNAKVEVYILSDPYCPFCKEQLAQAIQLAKQNKIKLFVIPFDIHGEKSTLASMIFWDMEAKSNLEEALMKVEAASFENVDKIVAQNQNLIKKLTPIYEVKLKNLKDNFLKNKLSGTPSIIIRKSATTGIVIVGLTDLTKIIK